MAKSTPKPSGGGWEARNARARSLGYRNYYDYRVRGYGAKPPKAEKPSGEALARARGHRSAADLERAVGTGDVVSVWTYGPRGKDGRYQWVDMLLQDSSGKERIFRLRGKQITAKRLGQITDRIHDAGGVISPAPSLDVRTLMEDLEGEDEE